MSKTPFSKKCEIVGSVWLHYRDDSRQDEGWSQYFDVYDIGLPLAYMIWSDIATATEGSEMYVEEAWEDLCAIINVDPDGEYTDLNHIFSVSPNEPIDK